MKFLDTLAFKTAKAVTLFIRRGYFRRTRRFLPLASRQRIASKFSYLKTRNSPDRTILIKEILPRLVNKGESILWIGCSEYTFDYWRKIEKLGGTCWTMDIDPAVERWGRPGRHATADLCEAKCAFNQGSFDLIFCNGVFGWGVDTSEAQGRALDQIHGLLKPDGYLLLGWNTDRIGDPLRQSPILSLFRSKGIAIFPARLEIPGTTHRYEFLQRTLISSGNNLLD